MSHAIEEVAGAPLCLLCNAENLDALHPAKHSAKQMGWIARVLVGSCANCGNVLGLKAIIDVAVPTQLVLDVQACAAGSHAKGSNVRLSVAKKVELHCNSGPLSVHQRSVYGAILARAINHKPHEMGAFRAIVRWVLQTKMFAPVRRFLQMLVHNNLICRVRVTRWFYCTVDRLIERKGESQEIKDVEAIEDLPKPVDVNAGFGGIISRDDGINALSMKTFGEVTDAKDQPAPQLCTLPDGVSAEHWANSAANVDQAVIKRAIKPKVKPTYSQEVGRKLRKMMKRMCEDEGPFSKAKILQFASTITCLDDLQPHSWSAKKWATVHDHALADPKMRVNPSIAIKNEVLEDEGKDKPRFLIADGDKGQAAAKFVIKCFDTLWYEFRTGHHIKYVAKNLAMEALMVQLSKKDPTQATCLLEGDGSAWDACCNLQVRNDTENCILFHIASVLSHHPDAYTDLMRAHEDINTAEFLSLTKKDGGRLKIDAIRRSGHAGTSGLNGFINAVLWAVVLTPEPYKYLSGHRVASFWHKQSQVNSQEAILPAIDSFEGDDSVLKVPTVLQDVKDEIMGKWKEFGFNMKLFFRIDELMTFTGYDFEVKDGLCTGHCVPSIRRNIISSCFTSSTTASLAWKKHDDITIHDIAENAFLARGIAFEHCCPPLANAFLCLAEYHRSRGSYSAIPDEMTKHKGAESSFELTAERIRANAIPSSDAMIAFWDKSAGDEWAGRINGLAALESIDAYGPHFLSL